MPDITLEPSNLAGTAGKFSVEAEMVGTEVTGPMTVSTESGTAGAAGRTTQGLRSVDQEVSTISMPVAAQPVGRANLAVIAGRLGAPTMPVSDMFSPVTRVYGPVASVSITDGSRGTFTVSSPAVAARAGIRRTSVSRGFMHLPLCWRDPGTGLRGGYHISLF